MPKKQVQKRVKPCRTTQYTISLSLKEKAFLSAFLKKHNEKHGVKMSAGDLIISLLQREAKRQGFVFEHPQISLFEEAANEKPLNNHGTPDLFS